MARWGHSHAQLFDLMIMVVKFQLQQNSPQALINITRVHLDTVSSLVGFSKTASATLAAARGRMDKVEEQRGQRPCDGRECGKWTLECFILLFHLQFLSSLMCLIQSIYLSIYLSMLTDFSLTFLLFASSSILLCPLVSGCTFGKPSSSSSTIAIPRSSHFHSIYTKCLGEPAYVFIYIYTNTTTPQRNCRVIFVRLPLTCPSLTRALALTSSCSACLLKTYQFILSLSLLPALQIYIFLVGFIATSIIASRI